MENSSYTMAEAIAEAKRCLRCKVPQCKKGCPVGNDIPDWIYELSMGNLGNAMNIINAKSNLPAVCGRVCAHERQCEGNCVLRKKDQGIHIGRLEQFIADFDTKMNLLRQPLVQKNRGRVAVIGSGPAGLTVSGGLARRGFDVEIFEMGPEPGGVLMFGIPEYRLPKDVVNSEIRKICELGVRIHTSVTIGPDMNVDQLFEQGFDAIFLGTGAAEPKSLPIPGAEHPAVVQAMHFLRIVGLYNNGLAGRKEIPVKEGDKVYVMGCGNTAMDAARTAVRCGASDVTVIYHRAIENMRALRSEYDDAVAEGVKFRWNTNIEEVLPNGDSAILRLKHPDGIDTVLADRLFLAVGSKPADRIISTTTGIEVDDNGYLITRDFPHGMTTRKGVFAAGDVAGTQATVVHAMSNARAVASGIETYVDALKLMQSIENSNQ